MSNKQFAMLVISIVFLGLCILGHGFLTARGFYRFEVRDDYIYKYNLLTGKITVMAFQPEGVINDLEKHLWKGMKKKLASNKKIP